MSRVIAALLTALPLIMTPAMVAQGMNNATGASAAGMLFAVAVALVLTLLLRRTAHRLINSVATLVGDFRLRTLLLRNSDYLLSDFIVPGAYGGLSKIDHALLTPAGVVCIRAVHRHGKVHGVADDAQWCHVSAGRRRRFLNPLIQNEGRARALSSAVAPTPVHNLVVFTGSTHFASAVAPNVVGLSQLETWLNKLTFGPDTVTDIDSNWQRLSAAAITDAESRKDYQAQIGFC